MHSETTDYHAELDAAVEAAIAGGAIVKTFYEDATAATYEKRDGSPVTDADLAADHAIRRVLAHRFPGDSLLTEEGQDDLARVGSTRCWIVDPIDGTEQFIGRTGEFDVLVAFTKNGRPVAAAGFQPTTDTLVTATLGGGAWVKSGASPSERIRFDAVGPRLRLATSKWFGAPGNAAIMEALTRHLGIASARSTGVGFTPRMFLSPRSFDGMVGVRNGEDQTMASEWDFAVTDLVISEAGGKVTDLDGEPFRYNKPSPLNVGGLLAAVDPQTHAIVLEAIQHVRDQPAKPTG